MNTPDLIHRLGFEAVYALPQFAELAHTGVTSHPGALPDADKALATLTPEQRDRVHHVALRRLVFQLLFALDASGAPNPAEFLAKEAASVEGLGPVDAEAAITWASGAWREKQESDAEFLKLAPEWPSHRMAGVDRAVLRAARYELVHALNPPRIAIHEAVELCKWFSTQKSPAFVNALLDRVAQRVEQAAPPPSSASAKAPS